MLRGGLLRGAGGDGGGAGGDGSGAWVRQATHALFVDAVFAVVELLLQRDVPALEWARRADAGETQAEPAETEAERRTEECGMEMAVVLRAMRVHASGGVGVVARGAAIVLLAHGGLPRPRASGWG